MVGWVAAADWLGPRAPTAWPPGPRAAPAPAQLGDSPASPPWGWRSAQLLPPKTRPLIRDSLTQQGERGLPAALFASSPGEGWGMCVHPSESIEHRGPL